MESANRDEAERCLEKARLALKSGKIDYAYKLALKSLRLCSTPEGIEFLDCVEKSKDASKKNSNHSMDVEDMLIEDKSSSTSGHITEEEEEYSLEQEEAVGRVLQCSNYYEVLSVARDVTDAELKKQYKQLALALHPDKNRAPRSEEAFKAISKAYATLSDPSRRNHYDRFGEDGLRAFPAAASPDSPDEYLRFVFSNGDDFLRFFEDTGFGRRNVFMHSTRSGRHFHTHYRQQGQNQTNSQHLWQIQLIMFIIFGSIFISLLTSMFAPPPLFSLRQNSDYTERRVVTKYNIPYFVKAGFDQKEVPTVERDVIEQHVWELKDQCRSDRYWGVGSKSKACNRLREIYGVQRG